MDGEIMNIEVITYDALPCATKIFTINGVDAEEHDFGSGASYESIDDVLNCDCDDVITYGCPNYTWIADKNKKQMACSKYNISESDFDKVCEILKEKLSVGECGWCI